MLEKWLGNVRGRIKMPENGLIIDGIELKCLTSGLTMYGVELKHFKNG